jgi:hypothetical protein
MILVPHDADEPLLFHVLTGGVPETDPVSGGPAVLELIRAGAELVPLAERHEEAWALKAKDGKTLIHPRDVAAGDAAFIFLSIGTTYEGQGNGWRPALAFSANELLAPAPNPWGPPQAKVGFRPHDLEGAYAVLTDDRNLDDVELECAEGEPERDCVERAQAESSAEELVAIARCGSIYSRGHVKRLVELYWQLFDERADVRAIGAEGRGLVAQHLEVTGCDCYYTPGCQNDNPALDSAMSKVNWRGFWRPRNVSDGSQRGPEVVFGGRLPLARARYYRHRGVWYDVAEELGSKRSLAAYGGGPELIALPQR